MRAMRMRRGVLIKSEKSSANTETGEDGRAVPAATKGAIDVGFAFTDVESGNGFFDKDRDMGDLTHVGRVVTPGLRSSGGAVRSPGASAASQREVLHSRRQVRTASGQQVLELRVPLREVPDLEMAALPHEHHLAGDAGVFTQLR